MIIALLCLTATMMIISAYKNSMEITENLSVELTVNKCQLNGDSIDCRLFETRHGVLVVKKNNSEYVDGAYAYYVNVSLEVASLFRRDQIRLERNNVVLGEPDMNIIKKSDGIATLWDSEMIVKRIGSVTKVSFKISKQDTLDFEYEVNTRHL